MPIVRDDLIHAAATVTGATGAAVKARNCVTARTGAGVYTVTVPDIDATDCIVMVSMRSTGVGANAQVVHTSDIVKTINIFAVAAGANVATDMDFDVVIMKIASGTYN